MPYRHTHTLPSTLRSGGQRVRECLLNEAVVDLWKQGKEFPKQTSLRTLSCERDQNDASGNHRKLTTNKNIWERGKEIRLDKDRGITKGLVHQWSNEMKPYRVWGSGLDQTPHLNAGHFCRYCYSWNRTKKWLCTHDTPSWIPLETTVRLWGGWKSYAIQVRTKASDMWLANVISLVLPDPGNLGSLFIHEKVKKKKKEQLFSIQPRENKEKLLALPPNFTSSQWLPGGSVIKNLPANKGDIGSIPGPGRYHVLQSN